MNAKALGVQRDPSPFPVLTEEERIERDKQKIFKEKWRAANIPLRHIEFLPEENNNEFWGKEWLRIKEKLLSGIIAVFIGNRGSGKTQMSICAIREMCKLGKSARYTKALNFFLDIRETFRKDAECSESNIIEKYCDYDLLVIDAIENRSDSAWENLLLNHLIDIRYDRIKDTILIGNYNEKQFAENMGLSIVDRIHECGIKIVCNWKSFRRN